MSINIVQANKIIFKSYEVLDTACRDIVNQLLSKRTNIESESLCNAITDCIEALHASHLDSDLKDTLTTALVLDEYTDIDADSALICYFLSIYMHIISDAESYLINTFDGSIIKMAKTVNIVRKELKRLFQVHNSSYLPSELIWDLMGQSETVAFIILIQFLQHTRKSTNLNNYKKEQEILFNILVPISRRINFGEFESEISDFFLPNSIYNTLETICQNTDRTQINMIINKIKGCSLDCKIILSQVCKSYLQVFNEGNKIYNLYAITVIVNNEYECYIMLGNLLKTYKGVANSFKDFIVMPLNIKTSYSGTVFTYKALQIRIYISQKISCSLTIQTVETSANMHLDMLNSQQLEKIDYIPSSYCKEYRHFIRSIRDIKKTAKTDSNVVCFSPENDLFCLPMYSSVLDFAFAIHSDLGLHFKFAMVNGTQVSYSYKIQTGDNICIFVSKQSEPQEKWLEYVRTKKAKTALKKWFRNRKKAESIPNIFSKNNYSMKTNTDSSHLPTLFISYNWENSDIADSICSMAENFVSVRLDRKDLGKGDSIREFMKSIRKQDFAVLIISSKYLQSTNCMLEVVELYKDQDLSHFEDKVIFYITEDAKMIFKPEGRVNQIKHWENAVENMKLLSKNIGVENQGIISKELRELRYISMQIGDFLDHVAKINDCFSAEEVINLVKKRLAKIQS